jgi:outer membrane lipoprotein SlyB
MTHENAKNRLRGLALLACCVALAACDAQSTIPIGPQTAAPDSIPEEARKADKPKATVSRPAPARTTAQPAAPVVQADLGEVIAVEPIVSPGEATGVGAAVGGVVGGLLGNQIGSGSGRKVATAIGAVGGAVAGHTVEKNRAEHISGYRISVRMDSGDQRSFTEGTETAMRAGDRVRVVDGSLQRA